MDEKYIQIINGPNLNLLGMREPEIYGTETLDDIILGVRSRFPNTAFADAQYNSEGDIIDTIHDAGTDPDCLGIILNAGAYTHTSLAIADAIRAISTPVVEVHLSNIAAREAIRHTSLIAGACRGTITGFGAQVYDLAVRAILSL